MDLLVSNGARAAWQGPPSLPFPSPTAAAAVRTNQSTHEHSHGTSLRSRLRHHCCLQFFTHHVSRPTGGIRNSKFSKQFQYFQYMLGILQWFMPERIQHLPHTDIGPFPVLGISVLCWSNSDSNFKIFSAAMSWQDSKSFPIPWLIRGG